MLVDAVTPDKALCSHQQVKGILDNKFSMVQQRAIRCKTVCTTNTTRKVEYASKVSNINRRHNFQINCGRESCDRCWCSSGLYDGPEIQVGH